MCCYIQDSIYIYLFIDADINKLNRSSVESTDDFEQRIFGDTAGKSQTNNSFYRHLDKVERDHNRFWQGSNINSENSSTFLDGLDESFNTLSDGMDNKLKEAARYFEYDPEEVEKEDYSFRKDVTFWPGNTYDIKVLPMKYQFALYHDLVGNNLCHVNLNGIYFMIQLFLLSKVTLVSHSHAIIIFIVQFRILILENQEYRSQ